MNHQQPIALVLAMQAVQSVQTAIQQQIKTP